MENVTALMERLMEAHDAESNEDRKKLLVDSWAELNRYRIVISQVRNARAAMSQISVT